VVILVVCTGSTRYLYRAGVEPHSIRLLTTKLYRKNPPVLLEGYKLKQRNNTLVIREKKGSVASKIFRYFLVRKYRG
jgi:hypothetical protein